MILLYFWLLEETLELRVKRDHVLWERQGYIQTTEGNVVHYGYIESFIEKLGERFNIKKISFDRWGAVQTEKIDGAIATIMALDRAIRCGNQNTESVYDSRGILFM